MALNRNYTETLISDLLDVILNRDELKQSIQILNYHICNTTEECLKECLENKKHLSEKSMFKINSIIDYIDDEMNIGHWSNISIELRRAYTVVSFMKALFYLKVNRKDPSLKVFRETLKYIDKGLLMGAPLENNCELLTKMAAILTNSIAKYANEKIVTSEENKGKHSMQYEFLYQNIKAHEIDISIIPSLQQFNDLYFMLQHPVKLQGCIDYWPAKKRWKNLEYLLKIAGDRTIPVEIGKQYIDENWSQELMTLREFIERYYLTENNETIGYLAQHNLLDQIPELREDICIPEYCSLSMDYNESCDPDINCWFGPAGTVSSLHYDPKNNLLVQVYGVKQILLLPPSDTQNLYPFEGTMLNNTSQVDPLVPNLEKFPKFSNSTMYKCLLKEGEMLFIPEKWWHHVVAVEKSFSVSFWWQ